LAAIAIVALLFASERAGAQPQAAPAAGGDSEYRCGPEDVLDIQAWGRPDLKGTVTVDARGQVQIPLVGEVRAEGRTPSELARDLTERFQLLDPSVSEVLVSVATYNSRSVTVLGEVRTPGKYGFREMPDVWAALFAAGGPTPGGELSRIQIIRETATADEPRTLRVDLSRGIDGTPADQLPALRPRDRIIVPSTADRPVGADTFHILGAVKIPGPYRISAANNVVEALSVAGGPLASARLQTVYLTRLTPDGVAAYRLNLESYLYTGKPLVNLVLEAGDTITIPEDKPSALLAFIEKLLPMASLLVTVWIAVDYNDRP
jgi:polysaccharide export outer membrane protein